MQLPVARVAWKEPLSDKYIDLSDSLIKGYVLCSSQEGEMKNLDIYLDFNKAHVDLIKSQIQWPKRIYARVWPKGHDGHVEVRTEIEDWNLDKEDEVQRFTVQLKPSQRQILNRGTSSFPKILE